MKTIAKRVLRIGFGVLLGLAICEASLRFLGYKYTGSFFTTDPLLGWSLRPGAATWEVDEGVAWTKINSHGYRDRERTVNKPEGVFRVAVLGDSYTEARQVDMDKTFTALAEEELNRRGCIAAARVQVLNFGTLGYDTAQELLQLRQRVWAFSPDFIVLNFFTGNDIFDNTRELNTVLPDLAPYFLLENGRLVLDDSFRHGRRFDQTYIKWKGVADDILNGSALALMIYKVHQAREQREELARNASDPIALPDQYSRYLQYLPPTMPSMVKAWQVTEALIAEFGKEVRSHDVPLLMLITPLPIQFHPDQREQEAYRAKYDIDSLDYADDRVEQQAHTNGIPTLRLSRPLAAEARRTGTYLAGFPNTAPNEIHFNERGHAVVARELVTRLCDMVAVKRNRFSASRFHED